MAKKKKDKGKDKVRAHERSKPQVEVDEEKPFDFGGLPQRDLKKNLGCG